MPTVVAGIDALGLQFTISFRDDLIVYVHDSCSSGCLLFVLACNQMRLTLSTQNKRQSARNLRGLCISRYASAPIDSIHDVSLDLRRLKWCIINH